MNGLHKDLHTKEVPIRQKHPVQIRVIVWENKRVEATRKLTRNFIERKGAGTMKSIISFHLPTRDLTLERAIMFFYICRKSNHSLYLHKNDQTCQIERMTELISFLLTSDDHHILIIIEGNEAKTVMKQLIGYMYAYKTSEEDAKKLSFNTIAKSHHKTY